jgi:hypothetical protein
MRPPTQKQSALSAPLNAILGTETNVRVLRLLSTLNQPLSPNEVARRTALQPSGVRRALHELANIGVVEFVGIGTRQHVQFRNEHPLAEAIRTLFRAEIDRVRVIYTGIAAVAQRLSPPPKAVWIEGPVATSTDRLNDPIMVGILGNSKDIGKLVEHLQEGIASVERVQDVTIDLHGWTIPDLRAVQEPDETRLIEAHPIFGPPPVMFLASKRAMVWRKRRNVMKHSDLDARARALGIAIANKLAHDPSLISQTRVRIIQLLQGAAPPEQRELREWLHILDTMSLPRLQRLLSDPGERATRLRQSLPFLNVLTGEERDHAVESPDR